MTNETIFKLSYSDQLFEPSRSPSLVHLGSWQPRLDQQDYCNAFSCIHKWGTRQAGRDYARGAVTMTDKELIKVSNRAWNAFVDQLPEEITGRDLLTIIIRFVVNIANAAGTRPTTVCMMMYDRLNAERYSVKVVNSIESVLQFVNIVTLIVGTVCVLWFNYQFGTKLFGVGCICILACWALEFVMKVIDRWL